MLGCRQPTGKRGSRRTLFHLLSHPVVDYGFRVKQAMEKRKRAVHICECLPTRSQTNPKITQSYKSSSFTNQIMMRVEFEI
jgi:hypothetical protein